MHLQPVINISLNARVKIFGCLRRIPAQLPTAFTPGTRVRPHVRKDELVRLRVQIRLAQLSNLWRRYLPTRVKSLSDRFDHSELLVLSALEEIVSVAARGWLFSRNDRVEEDAEEPSDLTYFKSMSIGVELHKLHFRTFIDMHMWPDILAFTDVDGSAQLDSQLDPVRNLLGVRLLETLLDKDGVGKTPNCGRKNDPRPCIPWAR